MERQAKTAGVTTIPAQLPLHGQVFHLEKILVLERPLSVEVDYSKLPRKGK